MKGSSAMMIHALFTVFSVAEPSDWGRSLPCMMFLSFIWKLYRDDF